jgi:type I restriction enzyme R subunit
MSQGSLSERDICTKFITPALEKAGWNIQTQVREEVRLTDGKVVAKVEHLMKLCNALESALRRSEDRATKRAQAVVQEMVA